MKLLLSVIIVYCCLLSSIADAQVVSTWIPAPVYVQPTPVVYTQYYQYPVYYPVVVQEVRLVPVVEQKLVPVPVYIYEDRHRCVVRPFGWIRYGY